MISSKKEIEKLRGLLAIEKKEEQEQYYSFIQNNTIKDQIKKGVCWHPIRLEENGYGLGDYTYLIGNRKEAAKKKSFLSSGKPVEVFAGDDVAKGVIHFVTDTKIRVNFTSDELPDFIKRGPFGVRLLFDETSFEEMEKALTYVEKATNNRLADLREILMGNEAPRFDTIMYRMELKSLNDSQNDAVNQLLAAKDVAVVHGPPGTGKTTTLVQTIKLLSKEVKNVLVSAPSNTAADVLTERLVHEGVKVVRIGNLSRISEAVVSSSLEVLVAEHEYYKDIKRLRKQADEYKRMASKYKRNFGRSEREQRNKLYSEAKELKHQAIELENHLLSTIISEADAVVCTLVGANNRHLTGRRFPVVVIDEAAQSLEPACWIPILKADKVILAGDPFQLPPTVKSREAAKGGLSTTLMEKCIARFPNAVTLLNTQYRMNEKIMGFSNQQFYDGKLQGDGMVQHWLLPNDELPIEFIDTAGCGFNEQSPEESRSLFNPEEYDLVKKHLTALCEGIENFNDFSVGIISPYKEQVLSMKEDLEQSDLLSSMNLTIQTIDGFQGQERDVMYISMVRSNNTGEIGFLTDYRRMNVAMTRAKKKLIIVGDSATLGTDTFYKNMIDYIEKENGYRSAWEFMEV
ncbi:MAG: AAA domain-containing protein [Cyclobacteriaceae bacterium]